MLSGSSTVLVTLTPDEHQKEFVYLVDKLGLKPAGRSPRDIAMDMIDAPLIAVRKLDSHGAPCSRSELIPDKEWATMQHAMPTKPNGWLDSQIIASSKYDGSISYMVAQTQDRKHLARTFSLVAKAQLKNSHALLDLYNISEADEDDAALEKICQIVTDIGFFGAAMSSLRGAHGSKTKSHLLQFDIGNPFPGELPQGRLATHTWDIVSLLGGYDHLVPQHMVGGIKDFRRSIVEFCYSGNLVSDSSTSRRHNIVLVQRDGLKQIDQDILHSTRAHRLFATGVGRGW